MGACEVCGNDGKSFEVVTGDESHTFDSLDCAVRMVEPLCEHCSCTVIGSGTRVEGRAYCCAHCARQAQEPPEDQEVMVSRAAPVASWT